jgi:hypothetical protein
VLLSEKNPVKTTINIKKENIIPAGRVINIDTLVNQFLEMKLLLLNFIYLFPHIFWFLISLKLVGVFVCPPPNSTQRFIIIISL